MKVNKNILNALLFNSTISDIIYGCCCPKKDTINKEKENEIDTSNDGDNKKETPEETLKKHQEENLKKINNVKKEQIKEEDIKEIISKNIIIEPLKDKTCDELIKKMNDEVEKRNAEDLKDVQVTDKDKGKAKYKSITEEFEGDPKIGLENIGATCYMNATLQCFSHIPEFVDYFKYKDNPTFKNERTLSSSFKLLIDNLWSKNSTKKYYAPRDFKNKISKMDLLFNGIAANDSKDLVNFIIMTLHKELNNPEKNYTPNNNSINQDQRNGNLMFTNFATDFMKSNRSLSSDLFYGINCDITQCCYCGSQSYNYQAYFFLVFPLEEVRKYNIAVCDNLINNNANPYYNYYFNLKMSNNFNSNTVNIYDCFNYDSKMNTMYGDNSMFCNYCKLTYPSTMRKVLTTGPNVLILILNRGQGIQFPIKVLFDETLDLTGYITYNNVGAKYRLIGVITHLGGNDMSGHFIAYCKDPITKKWNQFNDAFVKEVKDFRTEVIDYGMPYLLFYEKIKE